MVPQEIARRQRQNIIFFDETSREGALAGARLAEDDEAENFAWVRTVVLRGAKGVEEEGEGLAGRGGMAETAARRGGRRRWRSAEGVHGRADQPQKTPVVYIAGILITRL